MINSVVIVGRLTRDPELRKTPNGISVTSVTVAVDNGSTDAQGNKTTSFIPVNIWRQRAEFICNYAKKGSLVGIEGQLTQRSYKRKDGSNASVLEVVASNVTLLERKGSSNTTSQQADNSGYESDMPSNAEDDTDVLDLADDDLPF